MRPSLLLRAAQHRTPLIKFIGKRVPPRKFMVSLKSIPDHVNTALESIDHTPHAHPASPSQSLPDSFASYRAKAQQHGPLAGSRSLNYSSSSSAAPTPYPLTSSTVVYGAIGGSSGRSLGPIEPKQGEFFDRNDLPKRFRRTPWSEEEIEAVTSGGASLFG